MYSASSLLPVQTWRNKRRTIGNGSVPSLPGFWIELSFLPSIGAGYEKHIEDWWSNIHLHDLAAGDAARHWFRTSGLHKRFSILVVQNARALAKGGTRYDPCQRLVVHRHISHDQDSNLNPDSAALLGVDLVRCI